MYCACSIIRNVSIYGIYPGRFNYQITCNLLELVTLAVTILHLAHSGIEQV